VDEDGAVRERLRHPGRRRRQRLVGRQHHPPGREPAEQRPRAVNLDPTLGGDVRYCWYTSGSQRWAVFDWRQIPNATGGAVNSFQVWVGMNGVEDVTYTYGPQIGTGNGTALTVGAENAAGTVGATRYFKSQAGSATGTLPAANSALRVTTTPGEKVVTFTVQGKVAGNFNACAEVTSQALSGAVRKCFAGKVQ
jgi:hypothetical protein